MENNLKEIRTGLPNKGNVITITGGTVNLTIIETQNKDSGSVEALLNKIKNDRFEAMDANAVVNSIVTAAKEVGVEFAKAEQIKAKVKKK